MPLPQLVGTFGALLDRRELLIIDSRGGGRSGPVLCDSLRAVTFGLVTPPARMTSAIGACGRELGPRVGAYGVAAIADDIDAVRAALGVERLDLWGNSYASYVMTVYAGRHPERVRSIVLSGAYPIAYDPFGLDKLAAARRAIGLMCARTKSCSGRAVLRDVARVAARLRRDPVSFTARAGDRRFRLRLDDGALASVLWGGGDTLFLSRLPAAVRSARRGDLAPLRRLVETPALIDASALADPSGTGGATEGVFFAGACHDFPRVFSYADPPAARRAAFERALAAIDARRFAPFSREGWLRAGFESPDWCLEWPNDPTAGLPLAPDAPLPDVPVARPGRRPGRQHADARRPGGGGALPARDVRRDPQRRPHAGRLQPVRPRAGPALHPHAHGQSAGVRGHRRTAAGRPAGLDPRRAGCRSSAPTHPRAHRRALGLLVATSPTCRSRPTCSGRGAPRAACAAGATRVAPQRRRSGSPTSASSATPASPASSRPARTAPSPAPSRLAGPGTPDGRLRVRVTATGRGRAAGTLDGQRVSLRFRAA